MNVYLPSKFQHYLIGWGVGFVMGALVTWYFYKPTVIIETPAPAVQVTPDTAVIERKVDVPVPVETKKAAKAVGGKVVRTTHVTLQPKPVEGAPEGCECEKIDLDLGLIDTGDGYRTSLTTDDAKVLEAWDSANQPYSIPKVQKWDIGVVVPLDNPKGIGPSVTRHIGPFRLGLAAAKMKDTGWAGLASVTYSF